MKKIVFLILLFAAVALVLYVTSRVNPNLFAEIKILGALLNATIFGVALIALAIGEKELVRFPFLTASLLALFSGLVEGVLLFENRYYIAITAAAFVAFVFYLQIRHKRTSRKRTSATRVFTPLRPVFCRKKSPKWGKTWRPGSPLQRWLTFNR